MAPYWLAVETLLSHLDRLRDDLAAAETQKATTGPRLAEARMAVAEAEEAVQQSTGSLEDALIASTWTTLARAREAVGRARSPQVDLAPGDLALGPWSSGRTWPESRRTR